MADPKYANLPGIAYDQPDIYETSDLPESDQYVDFNPEEDSSQDIEVVRINSQSSYEKFRGKYLDSSRVDFSDRITKPSMRQGYSCRTTWELAAEGEPETTTQKFLRLKCEFQELVEEIEKNGLGSDDENNLKPEDIIAEVNDMQQKLLNVRTNPDDSSHGTGDKQLLKNKLAAKMDEIQGTSKDSSKASDAVQYELCYNRGVSSKTSQVKITELESRLQRLENVLGAEKSEKLATVALSPKNQTVLGTLSILNSRLALLEPSHIELIEARLSSVLQKVTKIAEKKLDVEELERTLKLSDLYDLMEESSATLKALPELSARLESLKELHENANEVVKNIENIKSLQEFIVNGTVENESNLKELKTVLGALIDGAVKK